MKVLREIGDHQVMVDPKHARSISLSSKLAAQLLESEQKVTKKRLLKALSNGDQYFPLTCHWELLDKCNFACPFCYIVGHSSQNLVRFSQIEPLLDEFIDSGLLFCTLTGGESTIHPDFEVIYRYLKERGVVVEVFTNGSNIKKSLLDLFVELPPDLVEVSLYSLINERLTSVFLAGGRKPASTVMSNILKMKKLGINVTGKVFINSETTTEFEKMKKWCENNDVGFYSSSQVNDAYDGASMDHFDIKNGKELEITKQSPQKCFPCGTVNYGSAITAGFELYPCPSIRHKECRYSLIECGVKTAIFKMKAFMRRFQDEEIVPGQGHCATCIAYAAPLRNKNGNLIGFGCPSSR